MSKVSVVSGEARRSPGHLVEVDVCAEVETSRVAAAWPALLYPLLEVGVRGGRWGWGGGWKGWGRMVVNIFLKEASCSTLTWCTLVFLCLFRSELVWNPLEQRAQ